MKEVIKVNGDLIRRIRRSKDWSAGDLAEAAGISTQYVYGIEQGRNTPSLEVLTKIATALSTSVAELITEYSPSTASNPTQTKLFHSDDTFDFNLLDFFKDPEPEPERDFIVYGNSISLEKFAKKYDIQQSVESTVFTFFKQNNISADNKEAFEALPDTSKEELWELIITTVFDKILEIVGNPENTELQVGSLTINIEGKENIRKVLQRVIPIGPILSSTKRVKKED